MHKFKKFGSLLILGFLTVNVQADVIGFTSFEESSLAGTYSINPYPNADPGRTFTPGVGQFEMGFTTRFVDSRATGLSGTIVGAETSDFAGVTTSSASDNIGTDPSGIHGTNFFAVDDSDGRIELVFDITTAGFTDTTVAFAWAAASSGFESTDSFTLRAIDADTNIELFSADEAGLEASLNAFSTETFNLEANGLTGDITLVFGFDNNADAEDLFLDNVSVNGNLAAVPEPASIGLLSLLGCGFFVRRRWSAKKKNRANALERGGR